MLFPELSNELRRPEQIAQGRRFLIAQGDGRLRRIGVVLARNDQLVRAVLAGDDADAAPGSEGKILPHPDSGSQDQAWSLQERPVKT
jgi:hypothetical protein